MDMFDIAVIGGGPAGMMAAGHAARLGARVALLEKNEKLGKKLYITGKGRCNLTNISGKDEHMRNVPRNPRFLHSALSAFDSGSLVQFFEELGVPLKTERGGRVFPASDKSASILDGLKFFLKKHGAQVRLKYAARRVERHAGGFRINGELGARALVIATGGLSYPSTGSTGDGYAFAGNFGHGVTAAHPSLVSLVTEEKWPAKLEGLSLKNVALKTGRLEWFGEMMFTDRGLTGPIALTASAYVCDRLGEPARFSIDLKPALCFEKLDARLLRDFFEESRNKDFGNAVGKLLPARLGAVAIGLSGFPPSTKASAITKPMRRSFARLIKAMPLTVVATGGFDEAVVTRGGVNVAEINPRSLMSKLAPGLFFAGEVIDVDALTGGYNLQIAFSTGYLAALGASAFIKGGEAG